MAEPRRWLFFSEAELACKCGCGRAHMHMGFMNKLIAVRRTYARPMIVTSGFRCPAHNARVSSTGADGPHTTGRAVDIAVRGADALRLLAVAIDGGMTGIGVQQKGGGRFLHLDDLAAPDHPRPMIWSY